jgi:hypothetical protein
VVRQGYFCSIFIAAGSNLECIVLLGAVLLNGAHAGASEYVMYVWGFLIAWTYISHHMLACFILSNISSHTCLL